MKQLYFLSLLIILAGTSCKKSATSDQALAALELKNVSYGSDPLQNMDVYLPAGRNTTNTKALIVIHGGAWMTGDKADMNEAVAAFKLLLPDYAIFNINYRLATLPSGNLWPTQLNDVNTAFDFISNKAGEYQFNKSKVVIGGASAGAHLALLKAYKQNPGSIKAVIDLFGPTDMADLYQKNSSYQPLLTVFMGGTPATNITSYNSGSVLLSVNASSAPTIILHGTADTVVPISQSDSLNTRLGNAGVIKEYHKYTGEGHGVWSATNTPDAFGKIAQFIKTNVK